MTTDIPKSYLLWFIQNLVDLGEDKYFYQVLGKPKKLSELEIFLNKPEHKYGYFILGCGVVEASNMTLETEEDDVLKIMETFIPLTTDEEIENFKKQFTEEIENYKLVKADEEQRLFKNVKDIIPKIDPEQQEEIFNILQASYKLRGEFLYKKADKVYAIVGTRKTTVELFNLIGKNLKNYAIKNRDVQKVKVEIEEEDDE